MINSTDKNKKKFNDVALIKAYEVFETKPHKLEPISKIRQATPQFIAVSIKNIVLLVNGMTLGFLTIVIPAVQGGSGIVQKPTTIILNNEQISWFSSIHLIFVPLGCFVSGAYAQSIGKRRAMQLVNIPIIISWLLYHFATSVDYLYAASSLQGFSGGLMEAPVLTYVAEITQPEYRGLLSASGSVFVILGIFLQFLFGAMLPWKVVAAISTIFPVTCILALFFIPESPTWLIRKNRFEEAVKSLQWLRGWVPRHYVEDEFNDLCNQMIINDQEQNDIESKCLRKFSIFNQRAFWKPFCLVMLTFFVCHFSGKTALQTYAVQIFHTLKAPMNKYYATVLLGLCELISTILCVALVRFTGKRPLVFTSLIGCGMSFFGTATYAYFINEVPGYGINNIVSNASSSNQNVISIDNLTIIFQKEEEKIIDTKYFSVDVTTQLPDSELTTESLNFELMKTTFVPTDLQTMDSILNRSARDADSEEQHENFFNVSFDLSSDSVNESNLNYSEPFNDLDDSTNSTTDSSKELIVTTPIYMNNIGETTKTSSVLMENEIKKLKSRTESDIIIPIPNKEVSLLFWIPLVLLLAASSFAHLGIRVLPWMLIGEVFPANIRNTASGFAACSGYIFGFLANKLFLKMLSWLTMPGTFWLNSCVALFGAALFYFVLPETEGRALSEIEDYFSKKTSSNNKNHIEIHSNIIPNDTVPLPLGLLEVPIHIDQYKPKSLAKDLTMKHSENNTIMYSTHGKYNLAYEDDVPIKEVTHL